MIYSTNRTASLGDITVDVNESYFGAGMLDFMQENAQDELALFEAAIKSDIDEVLIGESAYELEALNENFIQSAANKIREMMKKFIEWLESVLRSAVAKLTQLLARDNATFVKKAKKMLATVKNAKYEGPSLPGAGSESIKVLMKTVESQTEGAKTIFDEAKNCKTNDDIEKIKTELSNKKDEFDKLDPVKDQKDRIEKEKKNVTGRDALNLADNHIKYLDSMGSKDLKSLKDKMNKMKKAANDIATQAAKDAKKDEKDEVVKARLNLEAEAAAEYKRECQIVVNNTLAIIRMNIKIARSVVTKVMGGQIHEGVEYTEELVQAMIEASEYEYDSALEEMSEAKKVDDSEFDDIEDEE